MSTFVINKQLQFCQNSWSPHWENQIFITNPKGHMLFHMNTYWQHQNHPSPSQNLSYLEGFILFLNTTNYNYIVWLVCKKETKNINILQNILIPTSNTHSNFMHTSKQWKIIALEIPHDTSCFPNSRSHS
jgi:hypothetical protein